MNHGKQGTNGAVGEQRRELLRRDAQGIRFKRAASARRSGKQRRGGPPHSRTGCSGRDSPRGRRRCRGLRRDPRNHAVGRSRGGVAGDSCTGGGARHERKSLGTGRLDRRGSCRFCGAESEFLRGSMRHYPAAATPAAAGAGHSAGNARRRIRGFRGSAAARAEQSVDGNSGQCRAAAGGNP